MVLWGRSVLGCQKVPRKVPPRFRHTKVPLIFHQTSPRFVVSLVLWGSSVLGCQKVPQKVSPRFHQGSPSFVVFLVLWGRSVLGCQKVLWKVPPRFRQCFIEVPPKFHEGCASFLISVVFRGRYLSFPKGPAKGPPITSLHLSPNSFNFFFCIFLHRVTFGVFSHSKGLGAK